VDEVAEEHGTAAVWMRQPSGKKMRGRRNGHFGHFTRARRCG
jgi:hypothetical protein